MSTKKKQLVLNFFVNKSTGSHEMSWRGEGARPQDTAKVDYYIDLAKKAEAAKFHAFFIADDLFLNPYYANQGVSIGLEPTTLVAALATATKHIGLVATVSSTYSEPFNTARVFASLDHISNGRVGWNLVTSAGNRNSLLNFAEEEKYNKAEYYERASEFVDVARKLWDSWEDDALLADKATGQYISHEQAIREVNHKGKYFTVKGPLNVPRSPQGHPVLAQAGASEVGKEFAAKYADMSYTMHPDLGAAQKFYADMKARVEKHGRQADALNIIAGICPIVASTEEEAKAKEAEIFNLIDIEVGIKKVSSWIQYDLTQHDLDEQFPQFETDLTVAKVIQKIAVNDNLTVRQAIQRVSAGSGHMLVTGTPAQIADKMEEWFTKEAVDGFAIRPLVLPAGLDDFVELVVPELQRRGLFHTDYAGQTFRENLGLVRPKN